ncbi:MAG TPA: ribosomal protein S18-alanine N-acetyltransferase [Candidatus Hydrogenedentes bacterium]|nr:ribosomal protein S18-alanine N-acetyltransferase [Candidatus Hydrogenedentota bacterium]
MTSSNATHVEFVTLAEAYLDEMMEIELEAYPEPWSRGMFREEIRNNRSYFYVMLQDGQLAGYGGFWLVLDEAHITSVTVRDSLRGRGLGRRLTQHLLEVAEGVGAHIATLEVRESNVRAQNLYKAFGFRQIGRRRGYYPKSGEDAIVMLLELGSGRSPAQGASVEAGD